MKQAKDIVTELQEYLTFYGITDADVNVCYIECSRKTTKWEVHNFSDLNSLPKILGEINHVLESFTIDTKNKGLIAFSWGTASPEREYSLWHHIPQSSKKTHPEYPVLLNKISEHGRRSI